MLDKILKAREERAFLRAQIAKNNSASISLSLNVPGYPKSNENVNLFFISVLKNLKRFLPANRIFIDAKNEVIQTDEAGRVARVCDQRLLLVARLAGDRRKQERRGSGRPLFQRRTQRAGTLVRSRR